MFSYIQRDLLLQVEDRDSVSNRTDHSVAILGETQIPLAINCSEQVGKLQQTVRVRQFSFFFFLRSLKLLFASQEEKNLKSTSIQKHGNSTQSLVYKQVQINKMT